MATKNFFFIVLLLFISLQCSSQISIIPQLSSSYVQKLIDTAIANSPKRKSGETRIDIARSNIGKSGYSVLESVTVSYVYQPGQVTINPASPATTYFKGLQTSVSISLGSLFERPYVLKQARQEWLISKNDQEDLLNTLSTDVKKKYYVYLQRLEELNLQNKTLQEAEQLFKDIKSKFERGEEPFDSYNKAQTAFTASQLAKIGSEVNYFSAKADLEELLGTKLENVKQ